MNRIFKFYQDAIKLGLNKFIIFVSLALYLSSVSLEAIGIFLLLPIISLFLTDTGLDGLLGSQELISKISYYISTIGIEPNKFNIAAILLSAIVLRQIVVFARACWNATIIAKILFNLRKQVFHKFLNVNEDFFLDHPSGHTISDTTTEVDRASDAIVGSIEMLGLSCIFIVYLIMMLYLSSVFTAFSVISFLIAIFFLKKILTKSKEVGKSITINNRLFMNHLGQRFSNSRLLKLIADEKQEAMKLESIIKKQKTDRIKSGILVATTNSCVEPVILLTGGFILFGAILIFNQEYVNLGIFTIILIRGVPLVKNIFYNWQKLEITWHSLKAVIDTFNKLDQYKEINKGGIFFNNKKAPEIRFDNVCYKYKKRKEKALDSISFKIESESMTAIIGPSGAGKSTIIDCIPRLKNPMLGNIFIDNININNLELFSLRKSIGFLSQTPQILQGTIKDHISFGNSHITENQIHNILKKVDCEKLIKRLPDGLSTDLGSMGSKLSGGEKKRLDLARVLANKTPLLILDEPSANLDKLSELAIQKAILKERKERKMTVIVIAHKLEWFKGFDKIIIINNGRVQSIGSHQDLAKTNSWYREAIS